MIKVYVAGKLNDQSCGYIKNMHRMIKLADMIRSMGFSVFIPCLDFLSGLVCGDYEYQDYFENNLPWLESSDYVYVIADSENSKGTQREIARARELGIPVVTSIMYFKKLRDDDERKAFNKI